MANIKSINGNPIVVGSTEQLSSMATENYTTGKNLMDPSTVVDGYLTNSSGEIVAYSTYVTTDFIPVQESVKVTVSPLARSMLCYDEHFEPIASTYDDTTINTGQPFTYTPASDGYIRFSMLERYVPFCQVEYSASATAFEPFAMNLRGDIGVPKIDALLVPSKNLINTDDSISGLIANSSGSIATSVRYDTTDYIRIAAGQKVTISPCARVVLAYTETKSPIAATFDDSTTVASKQPYTFTASQDGYVRFSYYKTDKPMIQAEYGSTATPWVAYGGAVADESLVQVPKADATALDVDYLESEMSQIIVRGKNLIDPAEVVDGAIDDNGTIASSSTYQVTGYIRVYEGQPITASPRIRSIAWYDLAKRFYWSKFDNTSAVNTGNPVTFTPPADGFVRYTMYKADSSSYQAEYGSTATAYEPYSLTVKTGQSADELFGKKWAVCGDSFTDGAESTVFEDNPHAGKKKVYPYYISRRTGIVIEKFFASGQTLAYPADHSFSNSLTNPNGANYYQNIPADVDYVTIYLGINDSHHETGQGGDGEDPTGIIPIGTITDNDTSTYYGAWNVVLTWLRTNRPFAHVGIIVSNGCDRMAYREAQIAVAKKYGVAYIDLNGDQRTPAMIRPQNDDIPSSVKTIIAQQQAVNYPSNTHPNDEAHELESWFIESFLRSI